MLQLQCSAARLLGDAWGPIFSIPPFLAFGLLHASLPGPYGDEVLQAAPASRVATDTLPRVALDGPAIVDANLVLLHRVLPFFQLGYLGPVKTYFLGVAFALFGVNVAVMRASTILVGLVGLIALYCFARQALNRATANIVVILVGLDPSFVLFARDDWGPIAISFALKMIALYLLLRWRRTPRSRRAPLLAGVALGMGMSHKADFAWLLLAIVPVGVLLYLRTVRWRAEILGIGLLAVGFLLGAAPLLAYNVATGWSTWTSPGASLSQRVADAYPELPPELAVVRMLLASIPGRWGVLALVLDGRGVMNYIVGGTPSSVPAPVRGILVALGLGPGNIDGVANLKLIAEAVLLVASFASVGAAAFRCKSWSVARPAVACAVVSLLIFGMIAVTPEATGPHHAITVYPFPQLIVAYGLSLIPVAAPLLGGRQQDRYGGRTASGPAIRWGALSVELLGAVLMVVVVGSDVGQLLHFEQRLVQTGGDRFWSNAIDGAASFIQSRHPGEYVQTLDWGQRDQLITLLGPGVPIGFWEAPYTPGSDLGAQLRANHHVFVLHVEDNTFFTGVRRRFLDQLARLDLGPVQQQVFGGLDGIPNVVVVEIPWRRDQSLLADLGAARIVPPEGSVPPVGARDVTIGGVPHRALLQHPTSRVSFPLEVPTAARLAFSIGVDPQCLPTTAGADFAVEVDDGTRSMAAFETTMKPLTRASDRVWNDKHVDLSPWQGRRVTLSLVTRPIDGDYTCAWALWGDPTVQSFTLR